MTQKLHILFLFLTLSLISFSQVANQPGNLEVCDDENDGFHIFDLTLLDAEVLGSQSSVDFTVTYHETESNAINGVNSLASPYFNIINWLQTIYIRLEDNATENADITTVSLIVNITPQPVQPTSLSSCDDVGEIPGDEITVFDLTVKDAEITGGNTVWSVDYYETDANAQSQTNVIANPTAYTNGSINGFPSNPQTLYVAVTDVTTGCVGFATLTIRVLPNPTPSNVIPDLVSCDEINTGDGEEVFDLTENELWIFNGEAGTSITYHLSESDALSGSNSISDPTQFTNTTSPQTIYARVTNDVTGCFAVVNFEIIVNELPTPTPSNLLPNLELCDEINTGYGFEIFNLRGLEGNNEQEDLILNGESGVTLSYYETLNDADSGTNAISDPIQFTNTTSPQTIYARVEKNTTGCFAVVDFDIIVNPLPEVIALTDFIQCRLNTDGIAQFDLPTKDAEVLNGQDPVTFQVSYHENLADADMGMNALVSPYNNLTNPQVIFVTITNTVTDCSISTQSFNIEVQEAAQANPDMEPILYEVCDDNLETDGDPTNNSAQFDLATQDLEVLDGQNPADYIVTYYSNESDAIIGVNPLPTLYENIINPQVIYARVDNDTQNGTGSDTSICNAISEMTLQVNVLEVYDIDMTYSFCVGDSIIIDTGLNTSDYIFQWLYDGIIIPDENQPSLTVTQPGVYFVSVTSIFGCGNISTITNVEEVFCTDTDSDGVVDSDEDLNNNGNLDDDDTDDDGTPNYLDDDDDGDNVDTIVEINIILGRNTVHPFIDTDNDLIENYLDDDDDGDNVLTINEDYNNNGDPTDDDTNNNSIPDYLESAIALSVNDYSVSNFKLFPNPAKEEFTIQLASSNSGTGKINIYNIQGKLILKAINFESNTSIIDISNLESGLYFVELTVGNTSTVQKLIVN